MQTGQSPINLSTTADYAGTEAWFTNYKDILTAPHTSNPYYESTNKFDVSMMDHGFTSSYGYKTVGTPPEFSANQFHWHSGSEHTVDDLR